MPPKRASYDSAFKLKVVRQAAESGSNRKTAEHFGVDEKSVRTWKKQQKEIAVGPRTAKRLPGGGRPVRDKKMDSDLISWVKDARKDGIAVSGSMLKMQAKRKAESQDFQASDGWLNRFKRRHTLSTRAATSIGQKLPKDHEEKLLSFQRYVIKMREEHQYDLEDIFNMDETPLRFDMPTSKTLDFSGTSTIHVKTSNSEKRGFTVVLCVSATGRKLKPMIIFKGVRDPKIATSGAHVRVQKKGYIDEGLCLDWIRHCFPIDGRRRLLVWDSCTVHLTDRVKSALKHWKVDSVVIPGGMTSILQPLDVAVNRPFKHNARNLWNEWMMNGQKEYNKAGKIKAPTRQQVVQWTVESWGFITKESIINGFRKCCITNKLDGSEDDALFEDFVSSSRSAASDSSDSSDEEGVPGVPEGFFESEDEDFEGFVDGKDF